MTTASSTQSRGGGRPDAGDGDFLADAHTQIPAVIEIRVDCVRLPAAALGTEETS
jgi:hypothetical protein